MPLSSARSHYRQVFDPERSFIVVKAIKLSGRDLRVGARFPRKSASAQLMKRLFETRHIGYGNETGKDRCKPVSPEVHLKKGGTLEANFENRKVRIGSEVVLMRPGGVRTTGGISKARELRILLKSVFPDLTFVNRIEMVDAIEAELARRAKASQDGAS